MHAGLLCEHLTGIDRFSVMTFQELHYNLDDDRIAMAVNLEIVLALAANNYLVDDPGAVKNIAGENVADFKVSLLAACRSENIFDNRPRRGPGNTDA